ncbi:MAG: shikimate kinase / 3-dehydroquinate synthase [bacterium]
MALVLVGFMGAGKSSALPDVLDTDRLLEDQLETSITSYFAAFGEAKLRRREESVVLRALRSGAPVVALGGGSLGSAAVREALAAHTVVWLQVSPETAWERVAGGGDRPLAADRDLFAALHAEREPVYAAAADAFLPEGDRGLVARALPALRALEAAAPGTKLVWARTAGGEYPVYVGRGIAGAVLPGAVGPAGSRSFLVTDEHVGALYATRMRGVQHTITIAAGEQHKTLAAAEAVWRELAREGMGRDDRLVALGGGVVGDLAGFCAATYQRGVPVVQVPTTVVAQVDSAYGGKTGVDLPEAKNYVGAYHQPAAVVADVDLLDTLPPAELAAGFAEVVKTALIAGGALWDRVAAGAAVAQGVGVAAGGAVPQGDGVAARGALVDDEIVLLCARTKLDVVAADERDGGLRQVLNLGHTVGHAIETATGYTRYRHGEAVALGLLAALRLSGAGDLREQVAELLAAAGLPTRLEGVDAAAVVAATRLDKKRRGDEVPFVLVRAPGDVVFGQRVSGDDVLAAVVELSTDRS